MSRGRKKKKGKTITRGIRTGLLILVGLLLFYVLIYFIWGCG